MSRSPGHYSPTESPEVPEPERRLRLVGGRPWKSRQGIAVDSVPSASEASERVRWVAGPGDKDLRMLVPGETAPDAVVVLEATGSCPDLRRRDTGPVNRSRMSARIGDRHNHFILVIPPTGHAWDGSVHRTIDSFVQRAIDKFLADAVLGWPKKSPYPITLSNGLTTSTALKLRPEFPEGTPVLVAEQDLGPQMNDLAAVTHMPYGVTIKNNQIRLTGRMPREVQAGCVLGLAMRKDGRSCAVCFYFPSHRAVTSREQLAQVRSRLSSAVFKRRSSSGKHGR